MAFRLSAVGDVMVMRNLEDAMAKPAVKEVVRLLQDADHVMGNLEIPLCAGGVKQEKGVAHRASPSLVPQLRAMGFHSLAVANNHSMDYGPAGLLETIGNLEAAGIHPLGGGTNLEIAMRPHIVGNGDARVAVFAISSLLPNGAAATDNREGIAPVRVETFYHVDASLLMEQPGTPPAIKNEIHEADLQRVIAAVAAAKKQVDFVVMCVHWGVGLQQERAPYQQVLGRRLVEAGVDVVVGCHPHTIQETEYYKGGWIFYNLGEFFSQYPIDEFPPEIQAFLRKLQPEGYILQMHFTKGHPVAVALVPLALDREGDPLVDSDGRVADKILRLCEAEYERAEGRIRLLPPTGR